MAMIAHRLGAILGISCRNHARPYSNICLLGARKQGRKMRPETTWRSTFHEDMKEIWYSSDIIYGKRLGVVCQCTTTIMEIFYVKLVN